MENRLTPAMPPFWTDALSNGNQSYGTFAGDVAHDFRKPRISYARDFLLSLSELEICKSLAIGFDQSILREFEENSIQERPKNNGNLQLQGFRCNDTTLHHPLRVIQPISLVGSCCPGM
ncbi:hypothetical protein E3N88_30072 [Mikania micrantha]|uniref:Uncharacterized protein n=1 Tax=Mikania micrantha TaxID=192012 RepID=A0A5N6MLI4_9ASTR|nr:hypothetical protein E3N88_30072 [Mikania micrantha]